MSQLFCLEALCELSSDGVSASTLGAHDACRCASMPLASFKADLEVQRAGCRVLTRLCMHNPHCQANRDKLLRLKSAALVTRALKSFGKDKPLVLDALATATTLATPSEPTSVTMAAGFGEVGFLEVAVCVAEGLEGDGEVFGAMVQALAALVAANVANQPRLLELEDPLLDMLKQGRKKVGSDDKALLDQVRGATLIKSFGGFVTVTGGFSEVSSFTDHQVPYSYPSVTSHSASTCLLWWFRWTA